VGYGDRTVEEMGHAWVNITNISDREYADWLAAHKPSALPASAQFRQVPLELPKESGQSITPAYEGWWQNPDGTYNLLFGYFNRNTKETPDIPVGPNNHFDSGPPDQGQPTHFLPRRQKGVFTVTVPKDFGDRKLTWTITSNGRTVSVPGHLGAAWVISPLSEAGIGNTPPTISFDERGPATQGPKPLVAERLAKVGEPLELNVFAADDGKSPDVQVFKVRLDVILNFLKAREDTAQNAAVAAAAEAGAEDAVATPQLAAAAAAAGLDAGTIARDIGGPSVTLTWQKYRGPGAVTFASAHPQVEETTGSEVPVKKVFNGKATTSATFGAPGEYVLRVIANDSSGPDGQDFVCCWSNGEVVVKVR
jgi:hypothetical protein